MKIDNKGVMLRKSFTRALTFSRGSFIVFNLCSVNDNLPVRSFIIFSELKPVQTFYLPPANK